jgi:CRISPR/Cas system-associated endoribonuclease Cas2
MTEIAYYDIKSEMRKNRLTKLKQIRVEQTKSLQKAISQRGKEDNDTLKDILTKNNNAKTKL